MERKPFKQYNGGKNGSGVYQAIINQIPPHDVFVSGFAGNCGVMANKKLASINYAIDIDKRVSDGWSKIPSITAINADAISWLLDNEEFLQHALNKVFIFLDPPYLMESRSHQASIYKYEMTDPVTHKLMLSMARKLNHPVLITHYPNKLYDKILHDWRQVDIQGRTRKGMRVERLYMNYPEPAALHDYSFIGNDFRQREAYKRSKKNMVSKFLRMPAMERNYIISELKKENIII